MKEGWEIKKLGDVCDIVGGGTPSKKNFSFYNGEIPWATVRDMNVHILDSTEHKITLEAVKQSSTNIIKKDNVIIATRVGLGKICLLKFDTAINQDIKGIIPKKSSILLSTYLFHWFKSISNKIIDEGTGATVQGVKLPFLNNLLMVIPPYNEQFRIVSILDQAFAAIDKAKANAELNLKNAREIFESYLKGVFENKGEGWEEMKIEDICQLLNGRAYGKNELLVNGKYRVLRVGNFFTNNNWYYSNLELEEDKYCNKNDLLYAWSASFGPRIWKEEKVIFHYHIWKVIPNNSIVIKDFLYVLLDWDKNKIKASKGTGTTMIHVSKGSMEKRKVPIPPINEQQTIVDHLNVLLAQTKKLEFFYQKKIDHLEQLKKSLLHKAFSGELKTSDALIVAESV